jgi:hypothetical protein
VAVLVLVDDPRVDVGSPGDGRSVAQISGDLGDDTRDSTLALGFASGDGFGHGQPTTARTVACQVRKSLAVYSPPDTSRR